jgi:hypothetical protein
MEEQNVTEILSAADDSVILINGISDGSIVRDDLEQSEINDMVQRNVDHLEIILAYEEVVADSSDKSSYTDAISTGNAYIEANS